VVVQLSRQPDEAQALIDLAWARYLVNYLLDNARIHPTTEIKRPFPFSANSR
jgi:hypothetical protein